jgi:adenine-specific DNA-methyltransferase
LQKESKSSNGLLNQTNPTSTLRFPFGAIATSIEDIDLKAGSYGTDSYDIELLEDTHIINGAFTKDVVLKARFKWSQEYLDRAIEEGVKIKIPTVKLSPSYEKDEYEAEVPPNLINSKVGVGTNENGSSHLFNLFGKKVFDYPKPVSLVKYLAGFNLSDSDIILDFFAGSGSTAEGAMSLNFKNNCRFILVQLPEMLDIKNGKTEAEKVTIQNAIDSLQDVNKQPNLSELSMERIRRAGEKILVGNAEELAKREKPLDIGFKAFKLDTTNLAQWDEKTQDVEATIFDNIDAVKGGRNQEDLVYEVLLKYGVDISVPIETEKLDGKTLYKIAGGYLTLCLDEGLDQSFIEKLAEQKPERLVFRDTGFVDDTVKINAEMTLKKHGITDIKVL